MLWTIRCGLILLVVLLPAGPFATTFSVTKTEDTNDGTCDSDCSLREAIVAANTNPGADDVPVPAGIYLLTLGELTIADGLSIAGVEQTSTIIDGNAADRVIDIRADSGSVTISGVTIQNGDTSTYGGGIANTDSVDLTVSESTVSGNTASGNGAAIANIRSGKLMLTNSTVSGNTAPENGAAIANIRSGKLMLTNSTVSGNTGIGILNGSSDDLTIRRSSVSGNSIGIVNTYSGYFRLTNSTVSDNPGGGINNRGSENLRLRNSTVSGNQYVGIWHYPPYYDGASVTLINSTVSGNTELWYGGIVLAKFAVNSYSSLSLNNSTVTGNSSYRTDVGGIHSFADVRLTDSIVADNAGYNCNTAFDSQGYNLSDDASCGLSAPGDLIVADAMLGPLADNGGPTESHALRVGSPAIDAGSVNCPPPATDQRGVARPQGAACDIGAFELEIEAVSVEIDIRPGSDSNPINPSGRGNLPVTILGSETFDVVDMDVTTLAFGPGAAAPSHDLTKSGLYQDHLRDVNDDGFTDLVSHYRTQETSISPDDAEACITGDLLDGTPFEGCDATRVITGRRGLRR